MNIYLAQDFLKKYRGILFSLLVSGGLVLALFALGLVSANQSESVKTSPNRPVKVLFVGNSYTYFNNLPQIFEQLAKSGGIATEIKMITGGGLTLKRHWENSGLRKKIRKGSWDYVVLQEQSTLGAFIVNGKPQISKPQFFQKYARLLDGEIKQSGAKTVFFLTWAREDSPNKDQEKLNYAYLSIARELKSMVAPVGIVWQNVRRKNSDLKLYIEDKSHPAPVGSYLAACVLYKTIFQKNPIGLPNQISGNLIKQNGSIDKKRAVKLVELSPANAKLIQSEANAYQEKPGAFLVDETFSSKTDTDTPLMPTGRKPTIQELEGLWVGSLKFYPGPWPQTIELKLDQKNGKLKGSLKIIFEGGPGAQTRKIIDIKITKTGVSFIDPKGIAGAPMKYQAAFNGQMLTGIAEAKTEGINGIGSFELRRK